MAAQAALIDRRQTLIYEAAPGLGAPLFCLWMLGLITFSLPGRDGPLTIGSLDAIGLLKLASRVVALGVLGTVLWRSRALSRMPWVLRGVAPFGAFLAWAVASCLWSPLKAVSLGQAASLTVQLMLAASLAVRWTGEQDTSRILKHLSLMLLLVSAVLITIWVVAPQYSGLDRYANTGGDTGLVHPTSASATASLGILILLAARLIWNWRWTRWLIAPGMMIHTSVLLVATSRTALALTAFFALAMVTLLTSRLAFATLVVAFSLAVSTYLVLDPGLEAAGGILDSTAAFLERGESEEQLQSLNGRAELWEAVWREFCKSPVRGWGYFVTSEAGALDVWNGGPANLTAHNVLLQVLVSTGLVGAGLFLWALALPVWRVLRSAGVSPDQTRCTVFILLVWAWYLGWAQLCSSFMGPIEPETVVFYSILGLAWIHGRSKRNAYPPWEKGLVGGNP